MKTKYCPRPDQEVLNGFKEQIGFYFPTDAELEKFADKCFKKQQTRFMLNRLRWFLELADYQKYDSVKLFFLIAMAETNTKLRTGRFRKNDSETADVKDFFDRFSQQDKDELRKHFFKEDRWLKKHFLRFKTVVDMLINERHKLVHGKNHYRFSFYRSEGLMNPLWGEVGRKNKKRKKKCQLTLTYGDFKKVMAMNAIENIKSSL